MARTSRARFRWPLFILALASLTAGCVERLLQVRSDPPGATVYVNGDEVGVTPCDHRFVFYGTVDVTLRAPGHISRRELKTLSPPWYQFFPLDFVTDLLVPWTLYDVHAVSLELAPAPEAITPALRRELDAKAEALRKELPPESGRRTPAGG